MNASAEPLNQAIQEYLLKGGFFNTLEVFQHEITAERAKGQDAQAVALVAKAMDAGDHDAFFKLWNRFLPANIVRSGEGQKLTFHAQVYFAIFPVHPINRQYKPSEGEFKTRMEIFKDFLNTKGAELSKTEEFLHFYALPYIPTPHEHPAFKVLFTRGWVTDLKERVSKYFKTNAAQNQQPMLVTIFKNYSSASSTGGKTRSQPKGKSMKKEIEVSIDEESETETFKELDRLKKQFVILQKREEYTRNTLVESQTKWTSFAKEILSLTKDLYSCVENLRRGFNVDYNMIGAVMEKVGRYEVFLNSTGDDASVSYSQADHSISDLTPSPHRQSESPIAPIRLEKEMVKGYSTLPHLNYAIVIRDLNNLQDDLQVCALLQALRWRLSRSQAYLRKEILAAYVKYNILCTAKPHDLLLDKLLGWEGRVKEYTVRFLNVIATECAGRSYLLTKDTLIRILTAVLFMEREDSVLRQNTLGILQKLSLRRHAQSAMIELEMIDWLGKVLKHELHSISYYSLEYATALLMNLSLRTLGKDKIQNSHVDVLLVLNHLLEHENTQVRTYVNGTLYSVLTRQKLKDRAIELGMDDKLSLLKDTSDEHFKRQIQYILDQLNYESTDDCLSDDNDDEAEDRDEDETDLDEFIAEDEDMDDLIQEPILAGEELLVQKYMVKPVKNPSEKPFSRPATPGNLERNLPSELRSRPKIPRSPSEVLREEARKVKEEQKKEEMTRVESKKNEEFKEKSEEVDENQKVEIVEKKAEGGMVGTGEFSYAFKSRDKIPRSPL
jgi:LisH domain-containing protein ARMC9